MGDLNRDGVVLSDPMAQDSDELLRLGTEAPALPFGQLSGSVTDNIVGYDGYLMSVYDTAYLARNRFYEPDRGRWLNRDPAGYVDGMSMYEYGMSSPFVYTDPFGLDTYYLNRKLGGDTAQGHIITHTFVFTTNEDGSLKDTYSWGNDYDEENRGLWFRNSPNDVKAAKQAIRNMKLMERWTIQGWLRYEFVPGIDALYPVGKRAGGDPFDDFIEDQYLKRKLGLTDADLHGWWFFENCKHESNELVSDAKKYYEYVEKNNEWNRFYRNLFQMRRQDAMREEKDLEDAIN